MGGLLALCVLMAAIPARLLSSFWNWAAFWKIFAILNPFIPEQRRALYEEAQVGVDGYLIESRDMKECRMVVVYCCFCNCWTPRLFLTTYFPTYVVSAVDMWCKKVFMAAVLAASAEAFVRSLSSMPTYALLPKEILLHMCSPAQNLSFMNSYHHTHTHTHTHSHTHTRTPTVGDRAT